MSTNTCDSDRTDKLLAAAKALSAVEIIPYIGKLGIDSMARLLLTTMFTHPLLSIDNSLAAEALENLNLDDEDVYDTLDIVRLDMLSTLSDENQDLQEDALFDTSKLLERCTDILTRDYDGRFKLGFQLCHLLPNNEVEVLLTTDSGFTLGSAIKELRERGVENWDVVLVNIYNDLNQRIQQAQKDPFPVIAPYSGAY